MAATLLLISLFTAHFASGVLSATFTFKNNCPLPVWPGTLTGGPQGTPQLSTTGFQLNPGESRNVDTPPKWSGRFWARTRCSGSAGSFTCASADCASRQVECNGAGAVPPASLVELTLDGDNGMDTYDVSLVDGFNLPLAVTPQGRCQSVSCPADINSICPADFSVKSDGATVACKSGCAAFNDDAHCCRGANDKPETCPPTSYSMIFKNACPDAYSYAYDDQTSTFRCATGVNYVVTFCPGISSFPSNGTVSLAAE